MRNQDDEVRLPKGMTSPPVEDLPEVEPLGMTHVDANYTALIREALAEIPGLQIDILSLQTVEDRWSNPIVNIELTVTKEASS